MSLLVFCATGYRQVHTASYGLAIITKIIVDECVGETRKDRRTQ